MYMCIFTFIHICIYLYTWCTTLFFYNSSYIVINICMNGVGVFATSTLHWYLSSWVLGYRHGKVLLICLRRLSLSPGYDNVFGTEGLSRP